MKVAYIFSTQGHTVSYKLGKMILPQLEEDAHGSDFCAWLFAHRPEKKIQLWKQR